MRIRGIQEYRPHFQKAFPEVEIAEDITVTHIANAIGAFVATEWRSDDAPFDRYLRGNEDALTVQQIREMELFYGEAKYSNCHSGALQTDHTIHDGRRTASLRNIGRKPPYGGDGSYGSLSAFIRQHGTEDRLLRDLIAFLESLTDERGRLGKPSQVPSSLALD